MRNNYLNTLYKILIQLQEKEINNGFHYLAEPVPDAYAQSGLYFFFDQNIPNSNGGYKIIRIGITGNNENNRLLLHRNGNINTSVFRRHVRNALENHNQDFGHNAISDYIQALPYLFLPIANKNHLKDLEKRLIELVSNRNQLVKIDPPPLNWLGYNAIRLAIQESNLWNVHYVSNYEHNNENIYIAALRLLAEYVSNLE